MNVCGKRIDLSASGKVRVDGPTVLSQLDIRDSGEARIRGQSLVSGELEIRDSGKVRLGGQGPIFR